MRRIVAWYNNQRGQDRTIHEKRLFPDENFSWARETTVLHSLGLLLKNKKISSFFAKNEDRWRVRIARCWNSEEKRSGFMSSFQSRTILWLQRKRNTKKKTNFPCSFVKSLCAVIRSKINQRSKPKHYAWVCSRSQSKIKAKTLRVSVQSFNASRNIIMAEKNARAARFTCSRYYLPQNFFPSRQKFGKRKIPIFFVKFQTKNGLFSDENLSWARETTVLHSLGLYSWKTKHFFIFCQKWRQMTC